MRDIKGRDFFLKTNKRQNYQCSKGNAEAIPLQRKADRNNYTYGLSEYDRIAI